MCEQGEGCVTVKAPDDPAVNCLYVMPVRYAITHDTHMRSAEAQHYAKQDVFTDNPGLAAPIGEDGSDAPIIHGDFEIKNPSKTSDLLSSGHGQYTLRQLRAGYLHIYEEAYARWTHFIINFPQHGLGRANLFSEDTDGNSLPNPDPKTAPHCITVVGDCLVIPSPDKSTKVWFGYSDAKWTSRVLEMNNSPERRALHMRVLNIEAALRGEAQKHAGKMSDIKTIKKIVSEYANSADSGKQLYDFTPYKFHSSQARSDSLKQKLQLPDFKGVILALHDPAGVTSEIAALMSKKEETLQKSSEHEIFTNGVIVNLRNGIYENERETLMKELEKAKRDLDRSVHSRDTGPAQARINITEERIAEAKKKRYGTAWNNFHKWPTGHARYDDAKRVEWVKRHKNAEKDLIKLRITPLAELHVDWMQSEQLEKYFEFNFDTEDLFSGLTYLNTVYNCIIGTQNKKPCFQLYKTLLMSDKDDKKNLLARAIILNQDMVSQKITELQKETKNDVEKDKKEKEEDYKNEWKIAKDTTKKAVKDGGKYGDKYLFERILQELDNTFIRFAKQERAAETISKFLLSLSGPILAALPAHPDPASAAHTSPNHPSSTATVAKTKESMRITRLLVSMSILTGAEVRPFVVTCLKTELPGLLLEQLKILMKVKDMNGEKLPGLNTHTVTEHLKTLDLPENKRNPVTFTLYIIPDLLSSVKIKEDKKGNRTAKPTPFVAVTTLNRQEILAAYEKTMEIRNGELELSKILSNPDEMKRAYSHASDVQGNENGLNDKISAENKNGATESERALVKQENRRRSFNILTNVILGLFQIHAVYSAAKEAKNSMSHNKVEAEMRFVATLLAAAGAFVESTKSLVLRLAPHSATSYFLHSKKYTVNPWKTIGIVGAVIFALADVSEAIENYQEGNTETGNWLLVSAVSGLLAASVLFLTTGFVGLVVFALMLALSIYLGSIKDTPLQNWLERCIWGNTPHRKYEDLEEAMRQYQKATNPEEEVYHRDTRLENSHPANSIM